MKLYTPQECFELSDLFKEGNKKLNFYNNYPQLYNYNTRSKRNCNYCNYMVLHQWQKWGDQYQKAEFFCSVGGFMIDSPSKGSCRNFDMKKEI